MATEGGIVLKSAVLMAKTETTIGTDSVPVIGTNALVAYEVSFNPLGNAESYERAPIAGDSFLGRQTPVAGKRHSTISFKLPLAGSGAAGTAPDYSDLMLACGWSETLVSVTSCTYKDRALTEPCSIYFQVGPAQGSTSSEWMLFKALGCAGNVKITGTNGEPLMLEFEMVGTYEAPTDLADPWSTEPTLAEIIPEPLLGSTFSFTLGGAYAPICNGFEYDPGNNVVMRESINSSSGYLAGVVTDRAPSLSFSMEYDLVANIDLAAKWSGNTAGTATIGSLGSTAGNIVDLDWHRIGINSLSLSERDGVITADVDMTAAIDISNLASVTNACSIVFT